MSRSEINERYSALTDEINALEVKLANSARNTSNSQMLSEI